MDHERELAAPGYYRVEIEGLAAVELTATERAAHHRYTWAAGDAPRWLLVDLGHTAAMDHAVGDTWIALDAEAGEITGFVRMEGGLSGRTGGLPTWFVARFDAPWAEAELWRDRAAVEGVEAEGLQTGASLRFEGDVEVQVGISSVDLEGARRNLEREMPGWSFDGTHAQTRSAWSDWLSSFEIAGGDEVSRRIFASALYHVAQLPTLFTDVDGRYRGMNDQVHEAAGWTYYTDFSLWDTYRTFHPLVILAWPDLAADHARSLTDMAQQLGGFPRWPSGIGESGSMLGNSAEVVLAESFLKGVHDWPVERALGLAYAQAEDPLSARPREELLLYKRYGYVPHDLAGEGAAKTMEYAIDDHALGSWLVAVGEVERGGELLHRSRSFEAVIDPEARLARGRNADGSWAELEDEGWGDAFAEGNAWQYAWLAPHDPEGLAQAMGGRAPALQQLETFFSLSAEEEDTFMPDAYYWHGNEPDLHASLLFAALGAPELTQEWVPWVRDTKYADDPAGLDGNDDGGTLSSWYVLASIGLYPLNGTADYVLTTPAFDRVVLRRPEGALVIEAEGMGPYLEGAELDGYPLGEARVRHSQLAGERRLVFFRSEEPTDWGAW